MPESGMRKKDEASAVLVVLTTDDLHDYVDGRASPEIQDAVEALLEEDPRAARWAAAYRHQTACMHRAFGAGAKDVPHRLLDVLRRELHDAA